MAFIALRKGAVDGLSPRIKKMLKHLLDGVDLNDSPPVWFSPTGIAHYVFNDPRISVEDAAFLAVSVVNLAKLSTMVTTIPEGTADPYVYVAAQNGAPAALKMFNSPPIGWVPQEV
jgi:hypothetical protein